MDRIRQLKRFASIIGFITVHCYASKEELLERIEDSCDNEAIDIRTLQRDLNTIRDLFGIDIRFKRGWGYYIAEKDSVSETVTKLLSDFLIFNQLNTDAAVAGIVLPEHRKMIFNVDFTSILNAAKNCRRVEFDYTYFREEGRLRHKKVEPYFLKESQQRWYLVAKDLKDGLLKCFELGRADNLSVTQETFKKDRKLNGQALFKDSFGIWNNPADPVEDILLKFDALDGNFLKTLPLHASQRIVEEKDNHVILSLRLRITNDFVMALLSRSRSVEVLRPAHLRQRILEIYQQAAQRNSPSE